MTLCNEQELLERLFMEPGAYLAPKGENPHQFKGNLVSEKPLNKISSHFFSVEEDPRAGKIAQRVPGDGNCFYRCLACCLGTSNYDQYRQFAMQAVCFIVEVFA